MCLCSITNRRKHKAKNKEGWQQCGSDRGKTKTKTRRDCGYEQEKEPEKKNGETVRCSEAYLTRFEYLSISNVLMQYAGMTKTNR